MTPKEELDGLSVACPVLTNVARKIGEDAGAVKLNGSTILAPLPEPIIIDLIRLVSSLLTYLLTGCQQVPPNPSPEQLSRFLSERPRFSMRGMMIRRAARRGWRNMGLPPERVGISVDRITQSLRGTRGVLVVESAMAEIKKMKAFYTSKGVSYGPDEAGV